MTITFEGSGGYICYASSLSNNKGRLEKEKEDFLHKGITQAIRRVSNFFVVDKTREQITKRA